MMRRVCVFRPSKMARIIGPENRIGCSLMFVVMLFRVLVEK